MTTPEIIADLKSLVQNDDYGSLHKETIEAAIQLLEQPSYKEVLGKLRAELEERRIKATCTDYWGIVCALKIIDRYGGENEIRMDSNVSNPIHSLGNLCR